MGRLQGNVCSAVAFDDQDLNQLTLVIATKLRRYESFVFSWTVTGLC